MGRLITWTHAHHSPLGRCLLVAYDMFIPTPASGDQLFRFLRRLFVVRRSGARHLFGPGFDPCEGVAIPLFRLGQGDTVQATSALFQMSEGSVTKITMSVVELCLVPSRGGFHSMAYHTRARGRVSKVGTRKYVTVSAAFDRPSTWCNPDWLT